MGSLREFWESPNCRRLRKSVEVRAAMRIFLVIGVFFLLSTLLLALTGMANSVQGDTIAYSALYFILFLSLLGYSAYRVVILFLHIDRYVFTETLLDKPHQGGRYSLYFTVTLRDSKGREFQADTRPIFSTTEPNFEDYVNQKALIGYNEVTEQVVVIQKVAC